MRKIVVMLLISLLAASVGFAAPAKDKAEAPQPVTHPQLAELLVKALGMMRFLPNAPTPQQMFDLLMQNGISPEQGWKLDAVVSKADLSRVLIQAMRKEDAVENPNDPQSWIDALRAEGIALDRLSETIQSVEVLPESMSQVSSLQSTDPLVYGLKFAPGSGKVPAASALSAAARVSGEKLSSAAIFSAVIRLLQQVCLQAFSVTPCGRGRCIRRSACRYGSRRLR